ncbi:MAG: thioredoxin family protein [Thermoanaerobaculia bacterium]|nr:thioredoxin family protein [Thermoanaerobaculia bacterium]
MPGTGRKSPKTGVFLLLPCLLWSVAAAASPPHTEGWGQSLAAARAEAERTGGVIVVDLWADWCTWCKKLDEEVFTSELFEEWARDKVLLRVNTEDGGEGTRLQEDYGVTGLPTTLLLDADGVKLGELQGFSPAATYIQNLSLELAMYGMLVRAYDDVGDETPIATLQTLAEDFHSRRDGRRAAELYTRLVELDEDPQEEVWHRYYLADSLRLRGDLEAAAAAIGPARKAAEELGDEDLLELLDLLPYHIARDREACSEAEGALESYLARHPEGIYLETAKDALAAIRKTHRCA